MTSLCHNFSLEYNSTLIVCGILTQHYNDLYTMLAIYLQKCHELMSFHHTFYYIQSKRGEIIQNGHSNPNVAKKKIRLRHGQKETKRKITPHKTKNIKKQRLSNIKRKLCEYSVVSTGSFVTLRNKHLVWIWWVQLSRIV